MASRTTRSGGKRNANEVTPGSPPTSPRKHAPSQKRSKMETPQSSSKSDQKSSQPGEDLQIIESTGDIFDAPLNTLIIHACNCDGSWGAGIAAAFKDRYPKAYMEYVYHCEEFDHSLLDKAQLIPPVDAFESGTKDKNKDEGINEPSTSSKDSRQTDGTEVAKHFVGCLYTSRGFGRRRDRPARILQATAPAMVDLLRKVNAWNAKAEDSEKIGEVRMCKINSGLFAVPWEKTKKVLEEIEVERSDVKVIKVVSPAG